MDQSSQNIDNQNDESGHKKSVHLAIDKQNEESEPSHSLEKDSQNEHPSSKENKDGETNFIDSPGIK